MRLFDICTLIFIWQVFSPATVVFAGIGALLSVCILYIPAWDILTQTVIRWLRKFVQVKTLLDIFERIEMCFRRLETYTEVPLTTEMTDVIIQIMSEFLSALGIATKEIKQSRTSEYFMYKNVIAD